MKQSSKSHTAKPKKKLTKHTSRKRVMLAVTVDDAPKMEAGYEVPVLLLGPDEPVDESKFECIMDIDFDGKQVREGHQDALEALRELLDDEREGKFQFRQSMNQEFAEFVERWEVSCAEAAKLLCVDAATFTSGAWAQKLTPDSAFRLIAIFKTVASVDASIRRWQTHHWLRNPDTNPLLFGLVPMEEPSHESALRVAAYKTFVEEAYPPNFGLSPGLMLPEMMFDD